VPIYRIAPRAPLKRHVEWLWHYTDFQPDHDREHVLPDGGFDLIINLEDRPRKLFAREDCNRYESFKRSWISGAHTEHLIIDALPGSTMIGAHFRPGGVAAFLGFPASEMAGRVVELDSVWGAFARDWRDQILAARTAGEKFGVFESLLLQRLTEQGSQRNRTRGVGYAIAKLSHGAQPRSVADMAEELGMSHKHFIDCFRREVGLTPKAFYRIRRFQDVLAEIQFRKAVAWADVACACGYYDQAHFVNDFVAFSGMNPSDYLGRRLENDPNFARR
jgi:AraC-like DNA-binding protein